MKIHNKKPNRINASDALSTVESISFSELLCLGKRDFYGLMNQDPALKEEIETVARNRLEK